MVNGQRDLLGVGHDILDLGARLVGHIGLDGINLQIVGEQPNRSRIGEAELVLQLEPLAGNRRRSANAKIILILVERSGNAQVVQRQEGRDIDHQSAIAKSFRDVGQPDRRDSEIARHGLLLRTVAAIRPETGVFELHRDLATDPPKGEQLGIADPSTVEHQRCRAKPGLERGAVQQAQRYAVFCRARQGQQDTPFSRIGAHRNQPAFPGWCRHFLRADLRGERCERQGKGKQQRPQADVAHCSHKFPVPALTPASGALVASNVEARTAKAQAVKRVIGQDGADPMGQGQHADHDLATKDEHWQLQPHGSSGPHSFAFPKVRHRSGQCLN